MRYAYPCQITPCGDNELVVSFPDVPGSLTSGYSRAEALEAAGEALSVMLAGYLEDHKAIPVPSPVLDGQEIVAVDPVMAAKLELYSAMRDQGITKHALAERLGLSDTTVGRLTDPRHRSHIGLVAKALRFVGRGLVIEGRAA
ncbi:MAG: type II toxin-antitoxin system HicB family antitoxin [Bryobacterales bacterium]|nr:type II toxin-antitoxin system HicB family antitoxin [Bryobacterales bacterium]